METRSPISSHKHCFFKVLTPEFFHNVFIPRTFMAELSGEKMNVATLTSCKGNQSWLVRLKKGEKELYYFKKGWIDFMKDHDLKIGEFLLFEHKGCLKFDVLIFDHTYCEKTRFPASVFEHINKEIVMDDDVGEERAVQDDTGVEEVALKQIKEERSEDEDEYPEPQSRRSRKDAKHPKRDQSSAIKTAKAYKPCSPHFMTTIQTSNLNYQNPYLHISSTFVRLIEEANPLGNVIVIRDPDQGMIWSLDFHYLRGYNGSNGGKRMLVSAEWNDFTVSKNLKVGDVCVFELDTEARKNGIIILDVHIFRG